MRRAVAVVLAVMSVVPVLADEKKKGATAAMLEAYIEMARPVASHELLRSFAGRWDVTSKMWWSPTEPVTVAKGKAAGRMILGDRFLQLETTLGPPFSSESLTLLGFDRRTNDYTMVGYDTMGTYYITAAGKRDAARKALVLDGSYAQPPSGNTQAYRFVFEQPSADQHVMRLYFAMPDGKEMLVNEMVLVRVR